MGHPEAHFSYHPSSSQKSGMHIQLSDAGKRFNREWIFRHLTRSFETGKSYAITGPNGSGKSTLLQVLAGSMAVSEGEMTYREPAFSGNGEPDPDKFFQLISIAAPYLELVEEMTANEFLQFHHQFKPLLPSVSQAEVLALIGLEKAADKQIRYFSSGMKQRLKLAQAIFSDVPVLLMDEPCTNLDQAGYRLYQNLVTKYCLHKLVIISSNDIQEYAFCTDTLSILDYK